MILFIWSVFFTDCFVKLFITFASKLLFNDFLSSRLDWVFWLSPLYTNAFDFLMLIQRLQELFFQRSDFFRCRFFVLLLNMEPDSLGELATPINLLFGIDIVLWSDPSNRYRNLSRDMSVRQGYLIQLVSHWGRDQADWTSGEVHVFFVHSCFCCKFYEPASVLVVS